jgi:hypothetical protein
MRTEGSGRRASKGGMSCGWAVAGAVAAGRVVRRLPTGDASAR